MSYKCQDCDKPQEGPPTQVVTKKRHVRYEDKRTGDISEGWEAVEEKDLCEGCAEKQLSKEPEWEKKTKEVLTNADYNRYAEVQGRGRDQQRQENY